MSSSYILNINHFLNTWLTEFFSAFLGCFFHFAWFLCGAEALWCDVAPLIWTGFDTLLISYSKKLCLDWLWLFYNLRTYIKDLNLFQVNLYACNQLKVQFYSLPCGSPVFPSTIVGEENISLCVSFPFLAVCHGIANNSWASPSVPPTDKSVSMLPPASTEYYNFMVACGTGKGDYV